MDVLCCRQHGIDVGGGEVEKDQDKRGVPEK
jgi:hypothetical protein